MPANMGGGDPEVEAAMAMMGGQQALPPQPPEAGIQQMMSQAGANAQQMGDPSMLNSVWKAFESIMSGAAALPAPTAQQLMTPGGVAVGAAQGKSTVGDTLQTLQQNFLRNSNKVAPGAGFGERAGAGVLDLLSADQSWGMTALGGNQSNLDAISKYIQNMPAPSSSQLVGMNGGVSKYMMDTLLGIDSGRRWGEGTAEVATDVLTSPSSFIGNGLLSGLGKAAGKGAAKGAARSGLALADEVGEELLGAPATALVQSIQKGLVPLNNKLATMFPELPKWTEYAKKSAGMKDAVQFLESKGWDIQSAQAAVSQNIQAGFQVGSLDQVGKGFADQLPTDMRAGIDNTELGRIIMGFGKDQNTPGKIGDFEQSVRTYEQTLRKDMGLSDPGKFRSWYDKFNEWYKQQALGSLNYVMQNLQGGILMQGLTGDVAGAAKTAASAFDEGANVWRGKEFNTKQATDLAGKADMPIPASLHDAADRALSSQAGAAQSPSGLRDGIALAALGGIGEGSMGTLMGAGFGSQVGTISQRIRKSAQAVETVLREGAWSGGVTKAFTESMGDMENLIVGAYVLGAPQFGGVLQARMPAVMASAKQFVESRNGVASATDVADFLKQRGVATSAIETAQGAMDDLLYSVSQRGSAASKKSNFDYQDLSPVERIVADNFPFSTWFMKAAPFFAEQGARHPLFMNIKSATDQENADQRRDRGLSPRVKGVENGTASAIVSMITGRPERVYIDPASMFFPLQGLADSMRSLDYAKDDEGGSGLIKGALAVAGGVGLNPGPVIDTAIRAGMGLVDPESADDPARGYIRWAGPLAGVTALGSEAIERVTGVNPGLSVDLNRGSMKIEEVIRHAVTGQKVTDVREVNASRRLDEMAVRNTGLPITSNDPKVAAYVRAKRDKSGPLWEAASSEMELEKGVQSVAGFINGAIRPSAIVGQAEGAIREAKSDLLIDSGTARNLDTASEKNPQGPASAQDIQTITDAVAKIAAMQGRETPAIVREKLKTPNNANIAYIASQIYSFQSEEQPLINGYLGSGSPEQRDIQVDTAAIRQAGQGVSPEQRHASIQAVQQAAGMQGKMIGPIAAASAARGAEQDAILASNGMLQEWQAWKKLNPGKEVSDFLRERNKR